MTSFLRVSDAGEPAGEPDIRHRPFIRGDSNGDGSISIADIFMIIRSVYIENTPLPCTDAADFDDSGEIDTTDIVSLLGFIFFYAKMPPAPFPEIGFDTTPDGLDCVTGSQASAALAGGGGGRPGEIGQDVDFINFARTIIFAYPGQQSIRLPIFVKNQREVEGMTISVHTDPKQIWLKKIEFEGAYLGAIHPETVIQHTQGTQDGFLGASMLIDTFPPFEGRVLYPQALPVAVANLVFSISPDARVGNQVSIQFARIPNPETGRPAVVNEFSVRGESIHPLNSLLGLTVNIADKRELFLRGDSSGDFQVNITDAILILQYRFLGLPMDCKDPMDVDDDGDVSITDAVHLIRYLFSGGAAPSEPFPLAGKDPSPDNLEDCLSYSR